MNVPPHPHPVPPVTLCHPERPRPSSTRRRHSQCHRDRAGRRARRLSLNECPGDRMSTAAYSHSGEGASPPRGLPLALQP